MNLLIWFYCFVYFSKCFASLSISDDVISLTYKISNLALCRVNDKLVHSIIGVKLTDCITECGLYQDCKALNYNRHMLLCELFTSITEASFVMGSCIYIYASDINVQKSPCAQCGHGQTCDLKTKTCIFKECSDTSLGFGNFSGNINSIGSKISFRCNVGSESKGNHVVCQDNGLWNSTNVCPRKDCGPTPVILNGTIIALNGTLFGDTAVVLCDFGYYASVNETFCTAAGFWTAAHCRLGTDCYDIYVKENGQVTSGLYDISLWMSDTFVQVYCDMETTGGGWTVLQNRYDGSVEFFRNFLDYENGFGYLSTEFWLGLGAIKELASQGRTELRLDLVSANETAVYEIFTNFYLDEGPDYTLHIDPGNGTAGDEFGLSYNNGFSFSTYDAGVKQSCAEDRLGGWWYDKCAWANLNGRYATPGDDIGYSGMIYFSFKKMESLKSSKMMIRRY